MLPMRPVVGFRRLGSGLLILDAPRQSGTTGKMIILSPSRVLLLFRRLVVCFHGFSFRFSLCQRVSVVSASARQFDDSRLLDWVGFCRISFRKNQDALL